MSLNLKQEKHIILLVFFVQFVNILDFMMVMPLGPDYARDLGISMDHMGIVGGSYTLAAFLSSVIGSFFLDRIDRKTGLFFAMLGLSIATLAGALSLGLVTLLAARVLAGLFGGPANAVALSIVADVISPEKRGRAMGMVMSSFALASILGVPAGLELSRIGGWRMPFYAVGALGLIITALIYILLPKMKGHLQARKDHPLEYQKEIFKPQYLIGLAMMSVAIFAAFIVVPNLSAYLQFNLGLPREKLGLMYLFGGILSIFSSRFGGIWSDRYGAKAPMLLGTIITSIVVAIGLSYYNPIFPILVIFPLYMFGSNLRFVTFNTILSKIPPVQFRASYMSTLGACQHLMAAMGAFASTMLLHSDETGRLEGMHGIGIFVVILTLSGPFWVVWLERTLRRVGQKTNLNTSHSVAT